jgi:hypothetical protein
MLNEKYAARVAASGGTYKAPKSFQIDGTKEGKSSFVSAKSSVISNIDWSVDSKYLVANFKIAGQVVVWDIVTCQRIFQLDYSNTNYNTGQPISATNQPPHVNIVTQACFDKASSGYLILSGERACIV